MWAVVGVAQQLNCWSIAANEHGRSSAPFPSWQRAAFSRELFLSCFCQKSTGAFIETNCLWAQSSAIDKLIMQMRDCVQDVAVWQSRKSHTDRSVCTHTGNWDFEVQRLALDARIYWHQTDHVHTNTFSLHDYMCQSVDVGRRNEKWLIKSKSFDAD